jgi:hypothetical protein
MKNRLHAGPAVIVGICLSLGLSASGYAQIQSPVSGSVKKEAGMTTHAIGTFEVKLNAQAPDDKTDDSPIGRMSIDKQFYGALEAASKGQMLAAMMAVKGSAGYVAMERVSGTLNGRSGTFVLQHTGTMARGEQKLSVTVVPDSGTDQLVGLTGKMAIIIADGKHSYDFEYALAPTP